MGRPASLDFDWAIRTGGRLSGRQKVQLISAMVPMMLRYPAVRLRLSTGRRGTARLDLDALMWPDSALARDAEEHAREVLTPWVLEHSFRTWIFGLLLAQQYAVTVDQELTFVAAVLHDLNLEHPTPGRCFAVVGGERAERFALEHDAPPDRAVAISAAICGHLTPGVSDDLSDPAGFISGGALVDIYGYGLDTMDPAWVDDVHRRHPRRDLRRELIPAWKAEGKAVPHGRAATMTRYARLPAFVRLSPYAE
ncbi:phosphohydrolase [uncultured Jatrophihabitans sp.]|uniref:phosphohydrolase n=1 Tax=uncultured Jatrophihabitans sp. TaxID=1610747 RepID=UPI0035CB7587